MKGRFEKYISGNLNGLYLYYIVGYRCIHFHCGKGSLFSLPQLMPFLKYFPYGITT
jgi:hypothetical protein